MCCWFWAAASRYGTTYVCVRVYLNFFCSLVSGEKLISFISIKSIVVMGSTHNDYYSTTYSILLEKSIASNANINANKSNWIFLLKTTDCVYVCVVRPFHSLSLMMWWHKVQKLMRQMNFAGWLVSWFGRPQRLHNTHSHITTINLIVNSAAVTATKMNLLQWSKQSLIQTHTTTATATWELNRKILHESSVWMYACKRIYLYAKYLYWKWYKKQQRHRNRA